MAVKSHTMTGSLCTNQAATLICARAFSFGGNMKDISKLKDYRLKYKLYYGVDFGQEFAVHHIDFNRANNGIDNLILLPKDLHERYHFLVAALFHSDDKLSVHYKIDIANGSTYEYDMMRQFCEVMQEVQKWKLYKVQLEMQRSVKNG